MAVNAMSWVLADAPGDARYLVDSTLPVIAQLLGAHAVVLVSQRPGIEGAIVCLPGLHPRTPGPDDERYADELVGQAERLVQELPSTGLIRVVPALRSTMLIAPLPRSGIGDGYVVAAVAVDRAADSTDLAILGTVTNQLGGAIESSRRLTESEALRKAADAALRAADQHAAEVAQRNRQLQQARHDLVAAREEQVLAEERQRIARDLHDSVAQHVLSMGMQVEWCRTASRQPELTARLTEVKELARETVACIREAIFELSARDELQPGGLVRALRQLGDEHRRHGLPVTVRVIGKRSALSRAGERTLHMVAKEALFNTLLHAGASRASIYLDRRPDVVRLLVSDDGQGRAEQLRECLHQAQQSCTDGYHRGLANLDERVRIVGGALTISDAPGGGVRVEVQVPIARSSA
jgi:signal transduction histidine kinase